MVLGIPYALGVSLATAAAIIFAVQYIFVRLGSDGGRVDDMVLVSLLTNVALMAGLTVVVHGIPTMPIESIPAFAAAGIAGSFLARVCMFKSVETIGASRTSPVVSANVFFATILAVILFGERLTGVHAIGIVLIVAGVAMISYETAHDADPDASIRELGVSLALPLLAALFLGFEPIFVTMGLDAGSPVLPGVAIKAIAATIGFLGYLLATGRFSTRSLRWDPYMKWYLGAGVTSAIAIATFFAALEAAPVVIVVPLLQTAPLLVVIFSFFLLPQRLETITWRLVVGAVVVVIGAMIVSVMG